ncbi:TRAP transporter permease [Ammoniphilus resinae]|uniref:TRAP transporter 4TM/12TM fusion protein n=1 Tax=Ammoniphilus resinae TaxID=861532 RepID=A0ABS4GUD0_9BACL|nr:TRAP transporter permease [Ammoniphilus resinae]MBP1933875.1 TRAP transporter 4TM/12TM fusion protein [Ammoniphilus resinae]
MSMRENNSKEDAVVEEKPLGTVDVEEIAKKFDVESRYRNLTGKIGLMVAWIAVAMSVFHLITAGLIPMVTSKHRAIHLAFGLVLIFLMYPARKKSDQSKPTIFDYLLAILGAVGAGYLAVMFDSIAQRGMSSTTMDLAMGLLTMVIILEAARRSIGKELPILSLIFLAYAYLGPYLPGPLAHRGYSIKTLIEQMYLGSEGIFGIALGVSASYIFLFILFGAFLNGTGMSAFFTNGSMALAGHKPGGPAKVAILASGSLGMINGSAVANVATTGVFTIPLMHSVGYRKSFASGVEAVASTGGQIMPPIMGTAAFIMAEFLGIPYSEVVIAAIIPAALYYVALWFMVHYEAMKSGLRGIPKDQLPDFKKLFVQRAHLLLPIFLLMYMLFDGYTPVYAAFYSIISTYVISFLRKDTRMDLKTLFQTLESGAKGAIGIVAATAVVGYIVGVVSLTGIGLQLANMILVASNGILFLTLFMTMVACIILGMGLPTSACYIVGATVAAPALTQLGIEPITAHMFVLYFACLSAITPPVALAAYAGAGISGSNPSKVGWIAFRLGITGFLVPFIFVYSPGLLLQNPNYLVVGWAIITAMVGVFALGTSVVGFWRDNLNMVERILLFAAAILMIKSGIKTDAAGIAILALVLFLQLKRLKGSASFAKNASEDTTRAT